MKRFLIAAALIVVIIGVMLYYVPHSTYSDVLSYVNCNASVNIFCRKTSCNSVDLGLGRQVTCSIAEFQTVLSGCYGVDGVSVSFSGSMQDVNAIVNRLQATQINCQQLDDLYVACYTSNRLQGGVTLDGKRVNLQIAYRNGCITVGYPLILGSY